MNFGRGALRLSISLVLVAIALVAGGCGGGSGTPASGAGAKATEAQPAMGPAERFLAAAEAICGKVNRQVTDPKGTVLDAKRLARLAPEHARVEQQALNELSELQPPVAMAANWEKILSYRDRLATGLVQLGRAAKANDVSLMHKLSVAKERIHKELARVAALEGFKECGKTGPTTSRPFVFPSLSKRSAQPS